MGVLYYNTKGLTLSCSLALFESDWCAASVSHLSPPQYMHRRSVQAGILPIIDEFINYKLRLVSTLWYEASMNQQTQSMSFSVE